MHTQFSRACRLLAGNPSKVRRFLKRTNARANRASAKQALREGKEPLPWKGPNAWDIA